RDENGCGCVEMVRAPGDAEPVVACRRCDDAARAYLRRERRDRVERTAKLERAGDLGVLELEVDVSVGSFAQCEREAQRCAANHIADAMGGGEDLGWAKVGEHFGMLCVDTMKSE